MPKILTERVRQYTPTPTQRAWDNYLHTCRHAHNYEDTEPWAWTLLQAALNKKEKTRSTRPTPPPTTTSPTPTRRPRTR
jgi:hypothetical protein